MEPLRFHRSKAMEKKHAAPELGDTETMTTGDDKQPEKGSLSKRE